MILDPHERSAVEQRTAAIGKMIDEIDAKLDLPTFDTGILRERTGLFLERAHLNLLLK